MKATIPLLLLLSATLGFAEPAAPGGASSPGEPPYAEAAEPKPHAESAEPKPHAETAESAEAKPHAETAEPAAPGGASSPSEPRPHAESAEAKPHAESAESAEAKPHAEPAEKMPSAEPEPKAKGEREASPPDRAERGERSEPSVNAEPAAPGGASSPSEPPPHAKSAEPDSSRAAKTRAPAAARPASRGEPRSPCRAKPQVPRPPLHAEVSLIDGSTLKGTLRQHALPARSPNLGDIRVRLGQVESIAFGKPGDPAKIAFRNGDTLSAKFPADRAFVTMDTLVGRVRVPFDKVVSLAIEPPHSAFSTQHSALLYHCTFDSQAAVERPAAGPAGKFLGGEFVPGKNGKALRCPGNVPVAEVDLPERFLQPRGTIEFWAKIEEPPPSFPDRGNPRFFNLWLSEDGSDAGPCSTHLQFTANDGMGMAGLCGMIYHRAMATDPHMRTHTYRPLLDDPAAWHHYAIVWDSEGLPFAKSSDGTPAVATLVLDGKALQTFGRNQLSKGEGLLKLPSLRGKLAFPVPSDRMEGAARSVPFLIDEFKIWSVVKTDLIVSSPQPPKLLYHCTFDDAQSVVRPATGPSGTFLGGDFVPGKVGNALLVKARTPAAEVPFPTGLMQPEGCIEFWAKIPGATKETRYPDGGNPMFFAMGVGKWVNTFVKYTANDGLGTGGLHADLPGSAYISSLPSWSGSATYPDFLGDPAAWHHYALVWSEKGLGKASEALGRPVVSALYVDGRLVNPAYGTNGPDRAKFLRQFTDLPVVLGFPFLRERQDPKQGQVDYMIDEFKIWSVPKFDSAGTVVLPSRPYKPELIYHCTFDSAEAVEKSAAGPAGKFLGGEFVPGKKGNALRSPGDVPVAEVDLPRGTLQSRGTIEFWAKIEEPPAFYGDRGNPLFFGLWSFDDPADPGLCSTHLGFCANNGSGMAGLCGMVLHRTATTDPHMRTNTYGPVLGDPSAWHHYAIVWDKDGLPFAKASDGSPAIVGLVLDGRVLQAWGHNNLARGEGLQSLTKRLAKLAFPVPAARWSAPANHVPFLIDEFKIWSAPKTEF